VVFDICHSGKLVVETCLFSSLAIDCVKIKKPSNYSSNQETAAISVYFTEIINKILCILSNSQASFIRQIGKCENPVALALGGKTIQAQSLPDRSFYPASFAVLTAVNLQLLKHKCFTAKCVTG
jgi:hypothetical protein